MTVYIVVNIMRFCPCKLQVYNWITIELHFIIYAKLVHRYFAGRASTSLPKPHIKIESWGASCRKNVLSTIAPLSIKVNGFSASFIYQAERRWQADTRLKAIPQPASVKRNFKLSSPSIQTQHIFPHKTSTLLYRDAVM